FGPPLPRAPGVARRRVVLSLDRVHVLLALDHEHPLARRDRGAELRQVIQHAAHPVEIPRPAAGAVWAPLLEGLGNEAAHLREQRALLVGVVVLSDDART